MGKERHRLTILKTIFADLYNPLSKSVGLAVNVDILPEIICIIYLAVDS